jgi:hypothetical protein
MASASLAYRGRLIGVLLMLLGLWGALIPFAGPYFGFAFTPDKAWAYTSGRLWFSVVPGAAAFIGGLLISTTDRAAVPGAFLAVLGGGWYVLGLPVIALAFPGSHSISPGSPIYQVGSPFRPAIMTFLEKMSFFYGLGVVVLFFAALALGEIIVARMAALRYHDRLNAVMDRQDEFRRQDEYRRTDGYDTTAYNTTAYNTRAS